MPGTMDKADVIYGADEKVTPDKVDWTKIVNLTKPVTLTGIAVAKTTVETAKTDPAMKNAYVKVGTIADDLYMRIKVKTGAFKKDIKEDTLLAKGYLKLKTAMAEAADAKANPSPEAKAAANAKDALRKMPMGDVNAEGKYGERMQADFDNLMLTQVEGKYENALAKIKTCGDLMNKTTVTRTDAVNAKATLIQIPAFINGLEKGLVAVKAFLNKNKTIALNGKDKEVAKYDHVVTLRAEFQKLQTRITDAVKNARAAEVISDEYRTARNKVFTDYKKVLTDIGTFLPRANGLLAPAQAANDLAAIKQVFELAKKVRQDSADAFAPTRQSGDVAVNAYKVLTADDKADYLLDLTQAAKTANLTNIQAINAALSVLEQKLTSMTTPESQTLLKEVQEAQRSMNN